MIIAQCYASAHVGRYFVQLQFIKLLFIFLLTGGYCYGQHQERKVVVYNIGFGGLTAGIGSIINTPKGENWKKNFVRSFWQGCVGGTLHYTGKKTVFLINKNESLAMAWPAKL